MKKLRKQFCVNNRVVCVFIGWSTVFFTCIFSGWLTAETLRFGYSDVPAPPFQISHKVQPPGIAIEILREVGKKLGIVIKFYALPNRRVLDMLRTNQLDAAFMYSYKPARERAGVYPKINGSPDHRRRIGTLSYYLYTLKNSDIRWDGEQISGSLVEIGANSGYSIASDLRGLGYQVSEANTTEQNFNKLLLGRLSAVAHQDLVADGFLKQHRLDEKIDKLPLPLKTKDYFLIFSHRFYRQHQERTQEIWKEVGEQRDRKIQEIAKKY